MKPNEIENGHYAASELNVGDWYSIGEITIDADRINQFADLSGDRFEIHMSKQAARRHGFSDRVAHGLLVLSIIDGLKNNANVLLKAQASLGWDWNFSAPVIVGDTISATIEIADVSNPKSNNRAVVSLNLQATNQDGIVVQSGVNKLMMYM